MASRVRAGSWAFIASRKPSKVAFFQGASLSPIPPGKSKSDGTRYLDIRENDELDERQFIAWVEQASRLPGRRM